MPEPKPGDVIREALEQLAPGPDAAIDRIFGPDKAQVALAALDELEAERDVLKHAASMVENPEYVAALQQAGVEYVEQLVARIAEQEALLRRWVSPPGQASNIVADTRAALPDTEGEQDA